MAITHTLLSNPVLEQLAVRRRVIKIDREHLDVVDDQLLVEVPVALSYNGISYATMLATPSDLEDFAIGFSVSEEIITTLSDIRDIEAYPQEQGVAIEVSIAPALAVHLKERKRALSGKTGCGLCGVESLDQVSKQIRSLPLQQDSLDLALLIHAMDDLRTKQVLHQQTGAAHAAAWWDAQSKQLTHISEDVGRHNALDKLIGQLLRLGVNTSGGAIVVSSRASFEMVQKCMTAQIGCLAAASAPTELAIRLAEKANISLLGFVRPPCATIYHGAQRFRYQTEFGTLSNVTHW